MYQNSWNGSLLTSREGVKAFTQLLWRGKYWVLIDVILDKRSVFAAISTRYIVWWTVVRQAPLSMGIFQARLLEWVAISFSRESSQPRDWTHVPWILLYWQAGFFFLPLTPPGKTNSQLNWSSTLACGRWGSSPPKLPQGYTMGSGVYWMLGRCICQDRLGFALVTHKLWPCFSNSKGLFLAYTVCLLGSLCRVFSLQDPDWWSCHLKCGLWLWLRERKHKKLLSSS